MNRIIFILALTIASAFAETADEGNFNKMRKEVSKMILNIEITTTGLIWILESKFQEKIKAVENETYTLSNCTSITTKEARKNMVLNIYNSKLYKVEKQLLKFLLSLNMNANHQILNYQNITFNSQKERLEEAINNYQVIMAGVGLKYYYNLNKCFNKTLNTVGLEKGKLEK